MTFKGEKLAVTSLTLGGGALGTRLEFGLSFSSPEGVVHATTLHRIEPNTDPKILEALRTLLTAIEDWAGQVHFDRQAAQAEKAPNGIFESLTSGNDADDDTGQQG